MKLIDDFELLLFRTKEVREAQTLYFLQRTPTNLAKAKAKEKELDALLAALLKRGYDITRFQAPKQNNLL